MGATGTIVNGRVETEQPVDMPDGTKVFIVKESYLSGTTLEPYILERELRILRERLADAKTAEWYTLEEIFERSDAERAATAVTGIKR